MSTIINYSKRNNETNFDVFDINKNKNNFNSNKHSSSLRDQFSVLLSKCIIKGSKNELYKSTYFTSIMESSILDRIQTLENEILQEGKRIKELEKNKNQKLIKVLIQLYVINNP